VDAGDRAGGDRRGGLVVVDLDGRDCPAGTGYGEIVGNALVGVDREHVPDAVEAIGNAADDLKLAGELAPGNTGPPRQRGNGPIVVKNLRRGTPGHRYTGGERNYDSFGDRQDSYLRRGQRTRDALRPATLPPGTLLCPKRGTRPELFWPQARKFHVPLIP